MSPFTYSRIWPVCVTIRPERLDLPTRSALSSRFIAPPTTAMLSRSTPDSGSSKRVRSGACASSCAISERFISPPEKPMFTSRSIIFSSESSPMRSARS